MLRWILRASLRNRKISEDIRCEVGVASIIDKVREVRLQWYGQGISKGLVLSPLLFRPNKKRPLLPVCF